MGAVIGDLLPLAIGVAISPIPIIAAILMLLGKHARTTSLGFAAGWLSGIILATTVFVFLGGAVDSDDGPSTTASWIKLVLGVLLLGEGIREWRGRTATAAPPKWMSAIDEMNSITGFGIGFALSAINPKNLIMCAAAGVTVGSGALSASGEVVAVIVFALLAATTVVIPVIGYQVAAQRLSGPLEQLKEWLQTNNKTVMAILILVIGVVLIGKGIGGFS